MKKGAPLATVEASEFVQAQNDLATAVAQLKLARINETRKHALYEAKGGSLQDWQQAQADLTAAETAVHSVRNRLRILGKSDADIDALEAAHTIEAVAPLTAPIAGVVVDRQVGPGQYLQAGERHAGIHDRGSIERVAAGERARGGLGIGASWPAHGSARARVSEAHLRRHG